MSKKKSKSKTAPKGRIKTMSKADRDAAVLAGISAITPEMKARAVPVSIRHDDKGRPEKGLTGKEHTGKGHTGKGYIGVTGINVRDDYLLALHSKRRLEEGAFADMTGEQLAEIRMNAAERWSWDWHLATLARATTTDYRKLMLGRAGKGSAASPAGGGTAVTDPEQIRSDARKRFNTALFLIPPTIQQATLDLVIERKKPYAGGTNARGIIKARNDALTGLDILAVHFGMMELNRSALRSSGLNPDLN